MYMKPQKSSDESSRLYCGVCKIKFSTEQNFESHKIFCKPNKNAEKVIGDQEFGYPCPLCTAVLISEAEYHSHYQTHSSSMPEELYNGQEIEVGENELIMEEEYLEILSNDENAQEEYVEKNWEYLEHEIGEIYGNVSSKRNALDSPTLAKKMKTNIPPSYVDAKSSIRNRIVHVDNLIEIESQQNENNSEHFSTSDLEKEVLNWMINCSRLGFPRSLIDANGAMKEKSTEFIQRPFNLEPIEIKNIALKNLPQLKRFHILLRNYLKEMKLLRVFDDPTRIYNVDSSMFELYTEGPNVAIPNSYNKLLQSNVLFSCCADGGSLPPLVTLPEGDTFHFKPDISSEGFFVASQKYGIITNETLVHYIQDVFHPTLLRSGVEFPVILMIDGQKLNLSWNIFEICKKLQIVLISMYPNFNTVIAPTDIAFNQKIKRHWKDFVIKRLGNVNDLTIKNFPSILKDFSSFYFRAHSIIEGFQFTGAYPFNMDSINLKSLLTCTSKQSSIHNRKRVFVHKDDINYLKDAYGCNNGSAMFQINP